MIEEPFPIFLVSANYLLFDVKVIAHIRQEHHICGVLTGNIPRAHQQNVFNGIPLQLLPEEARLLVTKGHAFVVDDTKSHQIQMKNIKPEDKEEYVANLEAKGLAAATMAQAAAQAKYARRRQDRGSTPSRRSARESAETESSLDTTLFDSPRFEPPTKKVVIGDPRPFGIVPTVSYPPLDSSLCKDNRIVPGKTPSYDVFAHLHSQGYFLSPGIRFGADFMAYPGDPLRFHSHFLVVSKQWDEPIDLLDIVSGGRLGTGVKKSFMIGGVKSEEDGKDDDNSKEKEVKTYCIEWAAM